MSRIGDDFIWGVASASYQVEGGAHEGGRSESIWDRFASVPGNIENGDTGDVACDQYHRYEEDVRIMKELGIKAYRFSIAWPRVIPTGTGKVNKEGLDYYVRLVDALLEAGIEPMVTMYHWDLPQVLQDRGGWANPESADWFAEYAKVLYEALGSKVHYWMTFNESFCTTFLGYYEGRMAPGFRDFSTAVLCSHNLHRAHGKAVTLFRKMVPSGEIGVALKLMGRRPYDPSDEKDVRVAKIADGYLNRWFIEPLVFGKYPEEMVEYYKEQGVVVPEFDPEEMKEIGQPMDFVGINYYNDHYVRYDSSVWPVYYRFQNHGDDIVNDCGWPMTVDGFTDMLIRLKDQWGVKRVLITENGTAENDKISLDGCVHDPNRIDYMRRHIAAMKKAMDAGVNIIGYIYWSYSDNYEWASGYSKRFGLVYIDYPTQKRIIKDSGRYYSALIQNNGEEV